MGGDADIGDIIKIVVVLLIFVGPLIRSIFQAFFKPKQQQQGPRKKIHEVLEEMRREVAKKAERAGAPDAPPARRAPDPLDPLEEPVQHPQPRPRREAPRPVRPAQDARQPPRPERAAPRPERRPAVTTELKGIDPLESEAFKPIEALKSARFEELSSFETLLPSQSLGTVAAPPPRSKKQRGKLRVAGMSAKQLIVAQVVLGPPRSRKPRRGMNG